MKLRGLGCEVWAGVSSKPFLPFWGPELILKTSCTKKGRPFGPRLLEIVVLSFLGFKGAHAL